jgi:callose synthase
MIVVTFCYNCRNEALRVAFIHEEDRGSSEGQPVKEYYSKLVKADVHGRDQVSQFS